MIALRSICVWNTKYHLKLVDIAILLMLLMNCSVLWNTIWYCIFVYVYVAFYWLHYVLYNCKWFIVLFLTVHHFMTLDTCSCYYVFFKSVHYFPPQRLCIIWLCFIFNWILFCIIDIVLYFWLSVLLMSTQGQLPSSHSLNLSPPFTLFYFYLNLWLSYFPNYSVCYDLTFCKWLWFWCLFDAIWLFAFAVHMCFISANDFLPCSLHIWSLYCMYWYLILAICFFLNQCIILSPQVVHYLIVFHINWKIFCIYDIVLSWLSAF